MNWNERLEELLMSTEYEDLTASDQAWLEEQAVSAEQYRQWQLVLRQSRSLLQSSPAAPPPRLQQQLQASFRAQHPTSNSGRNRWKSVAIAASLATAFWAGRLSSPAPEITLPEPMVEVRYKMDTIYLERVVEQTIYVERPSTPASLVGDPSNMPQDMPELLPVAATPPPAPAGRTAKDDARLLDMAVEVY